MEQVTNQTFFHLQTNESWKPQWNIGGKLKIGNQNNPFFAYYDKHLRSIKIDGQNYNVNDVSRDWLNKHIDGNSILGDALNIEPLAMVQMLHYTLEHYLRYVREIIFEEVREQLDPQLPSRQRGLWLIPNGEAQKSIEFWKEQIKGDVRLVEIRATGKIHRGPASPLLIRTDSIDNIKKYAEVYWRGVTEENIDDELLFEGEIEVIDITNT